MTMSSRESRSSSSIRGSKVFNDPIHGFFELHPVCVRIIDTPQFQRLRHIKQLDACYLVYPGACHNRFEHSLGTCYLAGKLMKTLRDRQPKLEITDRDILCVEIAALCHDLGQGPFSHIFEKRFMPQMKQANPNDYDTFKHEHMGRQMFEHLLEDNENEVKNAIQRIIEDCNITDFGQFAENDFTFIKEMIDVPKDLETGDWTYEGRKEEKSFMYEIVANKRNGIDVDKWDYLARDSYMLGMKVNFDHNRCFMSARVIECNGEYESETESLQMEELKDEESQQIVTRSNTTVARKRKQICYREKDAQDLYDMFYTRMTLHRRAYQHKTHTIIGIMICEALVAANEHITFEGKNGNILSIAGATKDMKAYTQLTDDVFQIILQKKSSEKNSLDTAKNILNNILNRKLYKIVTQTQIKAIENIEQKWIQFLEEKVTVPQEEGNFSKSVVQLDYGMKNRNPMERVRFYRKDEPNEAIKLTKDQVSFVLPETFKETILRIYCTNGVSEQKRKEMKELFTEWCTENDFPRPKQAYKRHSDHTQPKCVDQSEALESTITSSKPPRAEPDLPDGNIHVETTSSDPNAAAEALAGVSQRDENDALTTHMHAFTCILN